MTTGSRECKFSLFKDNLETTKTYVMKNVRFTTLILKRKKEEKSMA